LQCAAVVFLRLQQQSRQLCAFRTQWASFCGRPAIELAFAAVQNGQLYPGDRLAPDRWLHGGISSRSSRRAGWWTSMWPTRWSSRGIARDSRLPG